MSDHFSQPRPKACYIAKGPRAAENADDDRLWFLVDTQNGMPVVDEIGITWFTRPDAKAMAATKKKIIS